MHKKLRTRVEELKREGAFEKLPWSAVSESDFWRFIKLQPITLKKPSLSLMDNGHLAASWRNRAKEQVALEFRGHGSVFFAIFAKRHLAEGPAMARSVGEENLFQLNTKLKAEKLEELVFG
jgi:hypothetical protein